MVGLRISPVVIREAVWRESADMELGGDKGWDLVRATVPRFLLVP
jgi:hypothetical protein